MIVTVVVTGLSFVMAIVTVLTPFVLFGSVIVSMVVTISLIPQQLPINESTLTKLAELSQVCHKTNKFGSWHNVDISNATTA